MSDFREPAVSGRGRLNHMAATPTSFDERYSAVAARDPRFDGQFIMAVRTTGIYCRPSCPARTPKRSNVTFYLTSAAAHEAGYRACKRCLPEAAPGSPAWNLRGDVVGRAMRLIADGVIERNGVAGLASKLGYSSRQLHRLLSAELGAGPLALARAQRAHTARLLLTGTDLPVAQVAFSSGFGSIRQCNDTIREVFDMTPTELRACRRGTVMTPGAIDLSLPVREPFDASGVFGWLASQAVPGLESGDGDHFARTLCLPGGPAWFEVREDPASRGRVRLKAQVTELADLGMLVSRVRQLIDLDADPVAIDGTLARKPELEPLVSGTPGIRVPGTVDPHEELVRAVVEQHSSPAVASRALAALVNAFGRSVAGPSGRPDRLFPAMQTIAERGHEVLSGSSSSIRAVTQVAAELADGSLTLTAADDAVELRTTLLSRPSITPWTADYLGMRVLGDPDVLLSSDGAARTGMRSAGLPQGPEGLRAWSSDLAPWRSYLTAHLWRIAQRGAPCTGRGREREEAVA